MEKYPVVALTLERAVQVARCPTCRAPRGEPCKTPRGRPIGCHPKRYEAARGVELDRKRLEAWNRDAQGVDG